MFNSQDTYSDQLLHTNARTLDSVAGSESYAGMLDPVNAPYYTHRAREAGRERVRGRV